MQLLLRDLRYGLRMLRKAPAFTLTAVLALALGIGANTAMFSVVNSVLLRPLPYRHADRLMVAWENNVVSGLNRTGPSGPNYLDFVEQNRSFEELTALDHGTATIVGFGEPEQVPGLRVTVNFLRFFGGRVALGRDFLPEEGRGGRHNVAIVSHSFWARNYGSDPGVVGKRLLADGLAYTVIGVLPPDFYSVIPAELLVPWNEEDLRRANRMDHDLGVIGRLKPGITVEQAREDLTGIERRIAERVPELRGWGVIVVPMQEALTGNLRAGLLVLLAAVAFVLLIACANLANLLLARSASREREIAIRAALGAGRWRLVRQFLTESMALGLIGGGLGLLLAMWSVDFLQRTVPRHIAIGEAAADILRPDIVIDVRVMGFTLAVSLLTGLVFGLIPALAASRAGVSQSLKEGGRNTASASSLRLRNLLAIAETALALILLVCSGLLIKSFRQMRQVDPGFRGDRVLTLEMELPTDTKYREPRQQAEVFHRILDGVEGLSGVRAAALDSVLPMETAKEVRAQFTIEGQPPLAAGQKLMADYRAVSAGAFATLGVPLKRGRVFTEQDNADHPRVAIIDETAVRRYFRDGSDPIGQRLQFGGPPREIVGIVGAVRNAGLNKEPMPTVYTPYEQAPRPRMCLAVRTAGEPLAMVKAVKGAVYAVDKDQPVYNVRSMEQVVASAEATPRFTLVLLGMFAGVALVLASIGIYGVISYTVAQRTGEIGLRIALGAQGGDVLRLIVGQGLAVAAAGVGLGTAAALALTRLLTSLLYGTSATDPLVFGGTALVLGAVAVSASLIPALRATKVDPIVSLRYE